MAEELGVVGSDISSRGKRGISNTHRFLSEISSVEFSRWSRWFVSLIWCGVLGVGGHELVVKLLAVSFNRFLKNLVFPKSRADDLRIINQPSGNLRWQEHHDCWCISNFQLEKHSFSSSDYGDNTGFFPPHRLWNYVTFRSSLPFLELGVGLDGGPGACTWLPKCEM